jgi:hypothetical protein
MTADSSKTKTKKPRKYVPHDVQAYRLLKAIRKQLDQPLIFSGELERRVKQIDRVLTFMYEEMSSETK